MTNEELLTLLRKMEEYKRNSAEIQRCFGNEAEEMFLRGEASALRDIMLALMLPAYAETLRKNYCEE